MASSPKSSGRIWNEQWQLGTVPRPELTRLLLFALMFGILAVLYHLQGVTTEEHRFGRSVFSWLAAF